MTPKIMDPESVPCPTCGCPPIVAKMHLHRAVKFMEATIAAEESRAAWRARCADAKARRAASAARRASMPPETGFVYALQNRETKRVKIGKGKDPKERRYDAHQATDCEVELLWCVEVSDCTRTERMLLGSLGHPKYTALGKRKRTAKAGPLWWRGEWFLPSALDRARRLFARLKREAARRLAMESAP